MADKTTSEERIAKENFDRANKQIKDALDKIRAKTPEELRNDEVRHLRARRSYLTGDDKEKYAEVLSEDYEFKPDPKKASAELIDLESLKEQAEKLGLRLVPNEATYKELQAQAKELGMKYVGVSEKDLRESLAEKK